MPWTASLVSDNPIAQKVCSILETCWFSPACFSLKALFRCRIAFCSWFLSAVAYLFAVVARNYGISVGVPAPSSPTHIAGRDGPRPPDCRPVQRVAGQTRTSGGAFRAIGFQGCRGNRPATVPYDKLAAYACWLIMVVLTGLGGLLLAYTVWPRADNPITAPKTAAVAGVSQALLSSCTDDQAWIACMFTAPTPGRRSSNRWGGMVADGQALAGLPSIVLLFLPGAAGCFPVQNLPAIWQAVPPGRYPQADRHLVPGHGLAMPSIHRVLGIPRIIVCIGSACSSRPVPGIRVQAVAGCSDVYRRSPDATYSQKQEIHAFPLTCDPVNDCICEPDVYGESLAYYASYDIFLVREQRFSRSVTWSQSFALLLTPLRRSRSEQRRRNCGRNRSPRAGHVAGSPRGPESS